jgi:hypothetical protein
MKNTYRRTIVKIPAGQSEAESNINLPSGDRIIALTSDGGVTPTQLVSVKIEESGNEIHPFMSHKVYDGAVGSFTQRGVELETSRGGDWTVKAKSTKSLDADTFIEMNFLIQSADSCE